MKKYTIKQAAEILEVSKSTIRRRIKSGSIDANKEEGPYGEQYFIPEAELDHAVAENDIVEVGQVNKPISKDMILNELSEAINKQNRALVEEVKEDINQKFEQQEQAISELKNELKELKEMQKNEEEKRGIFMQFIEWLYY